ncbi:hypothetical protein CLOM_g19333 [Closterium sp. NIES-68]|nr:hypothetical protein CLOM_g19333 [Closterium sp. NIES-68]GJP58959.1 hypothetical protein CLOP_g6725 [Closterium sp. NIES-67]
MALSSIAATSAHVTAAPRLTAAVSQDNALSAAGLVPLKQRTLRTGFLGDAVRQHAQARVSAVQAPAGKSTGLMVTARTSAVKQYEVEVDKPLGLTLGDKPGGGVQITGVAPGSNAARAGIKTGDQVIYTSSFFGDELWPSDNLGFTRTAVNAKADSVYFVLARGGTVDVKRLPKRPAPSRFGRKLTDAQKARATHICLDCGYIYTLGKPFEDQPDSFECPQCSAPKKRFARYDPETDRAIGGGSTPILSLISIVVGVAAIAAAAFYGFQ